MKNNQYAETDVSCHKCGYLMQRYNKDTYACYGCYITKPSPFKRSPGSQSGLLTKLREAIKAFISVK